ncbi:MAG: hypothetical protein IJ408_07160 [Clostridia bacterium]|nr:hypothetical protein [Clostridia bacterium]
MSIKLSKTKIESFCGDVLPIELLSDADITKADIRWYVIGEAASVRSFPADAPYSHTNKALITFLKPGIAKVVAELEGEKYECEIFAREMRRADPYKKPQYFLGDFHDHTSEEHKFEAFANKETDFPIDYINTIKKENLFDFCVISDHADVTNNRDFFRGFTDVELAQPMDTIIFPGAESEVTVIEEDRYGLTHKNAGEIVTINSNNFAGVRCWQEFYDAFKDAPFGIMVLAHPHVVGWDKNGIWNFSLHKNNAPIFKKLLRGVEMGNGTMRSSNVLYEYYYSVALDNGFKVSSTCASDNHSKWSFDSFPGKTVIMAPEKSKEMFLDALLNRRFYACESGNVKLYYTVNGEPAAQTIVPTNKYSFHIECDYFNDDPTTVPVECRVISDGGKTIKTIKDADFSSVDFEIESDTASYFYLRLLDSVGRKTWSAPVWTGREGTPTTPADDLVPINKENFSVTDAATGKDAALLINDDPEMWWTSDDVTAEVVIDMNNEYDVCALGQYPPRILLKKLMAAEIPIVDKANEFAIEYRVSTSLDGKTFAEQASGIFRIFGGENFITFPMHKARYVKFEALSTAGKFSGRKEYADAKISIGELTVFTK